jgi:chromosome segregation ATPase
MADRVAVANVAQLRRFQVDLARFVERGKAALDEVRNEARRTEWWMQYDRLPHWQREAQRRLAKVNEARGNLLAARLHENSETYVAERQALRRAEAALAEAEGKVAAIRHWLRAFHDQAQSHLLHCQKLANDFDQELPHASQVLGQLADRLEEYLAEPPGPPPELPPPPPDTVSREPAP